jgi:MFS family permease
VTVIFIGLAWLLTAWLLRPEPYAIAHPSAMARHDEAIGPPPSLGAVLAYPTVLVALVTLVGSQVVMVLIMTMTPLHLIDHGHGLATVGLVLSAHTFGMFALSPVSGRLADRFGSIPVIAAGLATLAGSALVAATAPVSDDMLLTLALFLLGFGWSLCFVSASSLLTRGLAIGERTRIQGIADALTWGTAAIASLSSGVIVAAASYTALGFFGAFLVLLPATLLAIQGRGLWANERATT